MEVKVNIIDTLFTTIPKNTVVASYTIDEDSVDLTMLNDQYSFNTANKTILTSSNVTSNNLKAINFTARNWVSGEQVEINDMYPRVVSKLQNKFNKPNTIYKVTKDLDLNHCVLTIPEGCTLQFDGGTISNGSLSGNFTKIIADSSTVIFGQQIHIEGSWDIADIYDEWFWFDTDPSYISNDTIKNILALSNDSINNTIHFDASRTYYFKHVYEGKANLGDDVRPDYWKLETEEYSFLRIFTGLTSNTHLIINNTLQMLPTNQGAYFIFHVIHKDNIEISGTGAINGDAKDHLYTDPFAGIYYYGEWGYGFDFRSCSNIVIRDITIGYCFGDGIGFGNYVHEDNTADDACRDVIVDNVKILYARRNGISLGGENYSITNVYFEGCGSDSIKGTAPKCAIDFENDHIATNPTGICRNCVMDSCKFKDNAYDMSSTIRDDWATIPNGTLITISNCNFTAPLRLNRTHGITFNSCHIVGISSHDNSITAWYASSNLTFNSCIFDELNPYLTTTAKVQGKTFNNCVFPEDTAYNTIFRSILNAGKAIKFSIPKPIIGEIEFKAIGFNSGVSPTYLPVNTTKYVLGNTQALTSIKKIDVYSDASSTPRYAIYRRTPVFSNINYSEDANNYNIYFTLGGELIGNPYTTLSDFNIFLKSNTRYIVIEAPVTDNTSSEGIYGGKWSEVSAITMTTINVSDIPSTVTFPNKDMYPASTVADLPTQLPPTEVGKEVFLLDDSYKLPAFWDSYSNTFRDADGNKILGRTVGLKADLDALAAKLTTSDRGYKVYYSSYAANLTWSGTEWLNVDGSRYETTRIIRDKASALTWSQVLGFENLTYIIVGDIDLGGEELVLGNNTILDFQGGSFSNGTIIGSNTTVLPNGYKIQNVSLEGSFKYPDGVNAVSSDGLCLNNVYDILDKQNLATTEINNYVVKDDDYTILSQFDTLKNVNAVDGSFIGFPTSVIYNNLLYCFYYKANTHESTPGIQENIYYKYSSDKGITWSEEKEWVLPSSDSNGTYRSYRTAYVVPFGSNLLFGIFCTTTTSSAIGGSFTLVCEATISEAHDITILNQIKTPIVGASGSLVYNYTDATITNSMIIGGNIIQVGSNYLMACYTSNRNNYVFSFDGNFTDNTHITQLDVISSEQFDYTEHAFIKFSDANFYIAFREDARRENTPIFKYDTSTSKFELFTYIDNAAYDGLDAIILDDNTAMIAGRDARNYFTPTRFALMNSSGKVFISNAKYYEDVLGRDCGYCSLQIIEDTLINIFYLKRSQPNYNYGVVSRRIPVKTLTNLIFY